MARDGFAGRIRLPQILKNYSNGSGSSLPSALKTTTGLPSS
jgi:hypothetical protein